MKQLKTLASSENPETTRISTMRRKEIPRITVAEMEDAETEIVTYVEYQSFPQEIASFKNQTVDLSNDQTTRQQAQRQKKSTKKSSPINKLNPFLKNGILHVGGHLKNSSIPDRAKHHVILPKTHHLVDLIIGYYHVKAGHSGMEHVFALIRQTFCIVRARVPIRKVLQACFNCKKR